MLIFVDILIRVILAISAAQHYLSLMDTDVPPRDVTRTTVSTSKAILRSTQEEIECSVEMMVMTMLMRNLLMAIQIQMESFLKDLIKRGPVVC